jgi:hypothetical protein
MQAKAKDAEAASVQSAADCLAEPGAPRTTGRALVPVHAETSGSPAGRGRYAKATFLAHLIAVERRLPQMRKRGRAAPADAAAVYSATLAGAPARPGRTLRRSA